MADELASLRAFARAEVGGDPEDIADWQQVAEALYERVIESLPTPAKKLRRLREAAEPALDTLASRRAEVERLPEDSELDTDTMRAVAMASRELRAVDAQAHEIDTADALAFRYELRAATAWLSYADLPSLRPID